MKKRSKLRGGVPNCPVGVVKRQEAPIVQSVMLGAQPEYSIRVENMPEAPNIMARWHQFINAIAVLPVLNLVDWLKVR